MVRAKFTVTAITQRMQTVPTTEKDAKGNRIYASRPVDTVQLSPVIGEENERFWTASPSGSLEIGMTNPDAAGTFKLGQCYYVDFHEAPLSEEV